MKLHAGMAVLAAITLAFIGLTAAADDIETETTKHGIVIDQSGVRPGHFTKDFAAAKQYADDRGMPLLAIWGSATCGYCGKLQSNALDTTLFKKWIANHPIVLVLIEADSDTEYVKTEAKKWIMSGNNSGLWPFVRLWWKKGGVDKSFTGRKDKMPLEKKDQGYGGKTDAQFVGTLEKYFGSWVDYIGGYFSVTNLPAARLEAVVGKTTFVNIPMFRTETKAAKNKLQIASGSKIDITWAAGVTAQSYKYTIPNGKSAGDKIELKLYDESGTTLRSSSAINIVSEPSATAISNPRWIGEGFAKGEWTMDLSAALKNGKKTLAVVGGDMWCPYCQKLNANVLGTADFTQWATDNNVNLVCIDMPQKEKTSATLLTRDESTKDHASGAAYLSRKMIADDKAKEIFERNKKLSGETWKPKSSTAVRLGNPTILLLKSDGTVAARLYAPEASTAAASFPKAETLNRFTELLKLSTANDADTDPASTTLKLSVETPVETKLQVNRNTLWYKLGNVPAGTVTFTATCSRDVTLTVYEGAGVSQLATGTGSVTATFANGANKYLKVSSFADAMATYGTNTSCDLTIASTVTLKPSEILSSFQTASGAVNLDLEAGKTYKLTGFSSYAGLTAKGGDLYEASTSKSYAMTAAKGATVQFQLWQPGTVKFVKESAKVLESDRTIVLKVTRADGGSDAASFTVAVDTGARGLARVGVSPSTVSWASGESGEKSVTCTVTPHAGFDADEIYEVSLAKKSGSAALGTPTVCSLTVTDTDDPVLPQDAYVLRFYKNVEVSKAYEVSNIREDGRVTIVKSGKLPSGLSFSYNSSSKTLVLSGKPSKVGKATCTVKMQEKRSKGTATGLPTTFAIEVVDSKALKPGDVGYNALLKRDGQITGTVPLYVGAEPDLCLAGLGELKISKSLKVSFKFTGLKMSNVSLSGTFGSISSDGTAVARIAKKGVTLQLTVRADGAVLAEVKGASTPFGSNLASGEVSLGGSGYSDYKGYYLVTLPVETESLVAGQEVIPTGTGYVILKMNTSSFLKSGKVSYSGMLANGKSFSGSSYLLAGAEWGVLPILINKSSTGYGGLVLNVRKGAAKDYQDDAQVVVSDATSPSYWLQGGEAIRLGVCGAYYVKNMDLLNCCTAYYEKTTFQASCETAFFAASEKYGEFKAASSAKATLNTNGKFTIKNDDVDLPMTLKVNKSTGVVTGSMKVRFAKKTMKLSIKGVVLPGWTDCCGESIDVERPFVSAAAYYKDTVGGSSAVRGFAIDLK